MKTYSEVQDRLRGVLVQELDRRVGLAQKRLPRGCVHNHRQELDPRKNVEDEANQSYNRVDRRHLPVVPTMGLCMLGAENPETWPGNICEDPIDAERCPYFTPSQSKDELLAEFSGQIKDAEWVNANLPEVAALVWVLEEVVMHLHLPWWKRVAFWFLRIRVEPVNTKNVFNLLPGGDDGVHGP